MKRLLSSISAIAVSVLLATALVAQAPVTSTKKDAKKDTVSTVNKKAKTIHHHGKTTKTIKSTTTEKKK